MNALNDRIKEQGGEVLGVNLYTRQKGFRFLPQEVRRLHQILQQLRHQFAGGRGVRLVEVEGSVFDISRCPAVMINDRHPVAGFQKLGIFHHVRTVGIHHHQQCPGLALQKRLAAGDHHTGVFRLLRHLTDQGMGGVVLGVDDDLALLAPFAGDAAHTHGRADGVHVRVLVAHDIYLLGVVDQLA